MCFQDSRGATSYLRTDVVTVFGVVVRTQRLQGAAAFFPFPFAGDIFKREAPSALS